MDRRLLSVAVIQAAAIPFDRNAGIERACQLIREAGGRGAKLIVLPEAFIPGYPRGLTFGAVVGNRTSEGREVFRLLWEHSVEVPSKDIERLGEAAKAAGGARDQYGLLHEVAPGCEKDSLAAPCSAV